MPKAPTKPLTPTIHLHPLQKQRLLPSCNTPISASTISKLFTILVMITYKWKKVSKDSSWAMNSTVKQVNQSPTHESINTSYTTKSDAEHSGKFTRAWMTKPNAWSLSKCSISEQSNSKQTKKCARSVAASAKPNPSWWCSARASTSWDATTSTKTTPWR